MANLKMFQSLQPSNIIVRMPNWLGDLVMATPILADLRHHWPEAKITAMCQGALGTVLQEDPHINEILSFKRPSGWLHRSEHGDIVAPLQQGHYDLGILLTNSLSSAWWFWRGGVQNKLGYATHMRRWLLDIPVLVPAQKEQQHLVITYKMLLEPLGIPVSETVPKLYVSKEEKEATQDLLRKFEVKSEDILVGINPGAAYGSAKCWLPERFHELSQLLLQNPKVKIIYFGDRAGAPLVDVLCREMPRNVINMAGRTTLRELISLIGACDVFLTNDSGPMHVASALGIPLLALFGSTSDVATRPYVGGVVIHKHLPCSPCYRRECPIDFRCMTRIEVSEVYQQLQLLFKSLKK